MNLPTHSVTVKKNQDTCKKSSGALNQAEAPLRSPHSISPLPRRVIFRYCLGQEIRQKESASVPTATKRAQGSSEVNLVRSSLVLYYHFPPLNHSFLVSNKKCIQIWKRCIGHWSYRQLKYNFSLPETCLTTFSPPTLITARPWDMILIVGRQRPQVNMENKGNDRRNATCAARAQVS